MLAHVHILDVTAKYMHSAVHISQKKTKYMQKKAVNSILSFELTAFYRLNLHISLKIPQNMHTYKDKRAYFKGFY